MRCLDETAEAKIRELYRLVSDTKVSRSHDDTEVRNALHRVEESGGWRAIPGILPLALSTRRPIASAVSMSVTTLSSNLPAQEVAILDAQIRAFPSIGSPVPWDWHQTSPASLDSLATLPGSPALLRMALCHNSGHVREYAIKLLSVHSDGEEWPYLLLRANDWVPVVRARASAALRLRLGAENFPRIIEMLPMLERAKRWSRLGIAPVIGEIGELLASPAMLSHISHGLLSPDRLVRRACYSRLDSDARMGQGNHWEKALVDPDSFVRWWAARRLCRGETENFLAHSSALLASSAGRVRGMAARRLMELKQPVPWRRLLLDSHASAREVAQELALAEDLDPAQEYRGRMDSLSGRQLAAGLLGLSESGSDPDAAMIANHSQDNNASVRGAVLVALGNLQIDGQIERNLVALLDESPAVSRIARELLARKASSIRTQQIWTAFQRSATYRCRRNCLMIITHMDHWTQLPLLLRAAQSMKRDERNIVRFLLRRGVHRRLRTFTSPPGAIAMEVTFLLKEPEALPASLQRDIRFALHY